jgi:pyruvate/2-oxoglutarate dehydrogenase complex dihydrolipoamide dehydrogenase (E3) component
MPAIMKTEEYDAIVIGSGQGGNPLAAAMARHGWHTAVIERAEVGGTCINYGCTPTKTMVAGARVAYLARRATGYGIRTGRVSTDMAKVRQRKRDIVDVFRSSSERRLLTTPNLDLIRSEASFTGPRQLEVTSTSGSMRRLHAERIIINTGTSPSYPPLPGLDTVPYLNSTTIMDLDVLPRHLVVLGGGHIGLEFGQMFRRFGSRVTIVQRRDRLLGREDEDVADAIAHVLEEDGIEILLHTEAVRVSPWGDHRFRLTVRTDGQSERSIIGSHLLVATGRSPNTGRLNLPLTGVEINERGYIRVNDRLETNVPGIYAIGDVNGGPAFTHISYDDFRVLRANLLEGGSANTNGRLVPYTMFTDPQLGRVGLTEEAAREQGYRVRVAKMPVDYIARALEIGETRGFLKVVVDADTALILGCAMLSIEGGELMSMVEIAMMGKLPYTTLKEAVFAHPTLAESLNSVFAWFKE